MTERQGPSFDVLASYAQSWEALRASFGNFYPEEDLSLIEQNYHIAVTAHKGVTRASGEPYIYHPLRVLQITQAAGLNQAEIAAAALAHDVEEDTLYFRDHSHPKDRIFRIIGEYQLLHRLTGSMGEKTAEIIAVLTVEKGSDETKEKREAEAVKNLRHGPIEGVLVKWADRIDNLETLGVFPYEKKARKVRETIDIFLPIFFKVFVYGKYRNAGEYMYQRTLSALETAGFPTEATELRNMYERISDRIELANEAEYGEIAEISDDELDL